MPFIHIRSLPFDRELDVSAVIAGLSDDVALDTGVELKHLHVTWQFLEPGHYAGGGQTALRQPDDTHPILIELLTPDFLDVATSGQMSMAIARSLAARAGVSRKNIFIHHRRALSGSVFDGGDVVSWPLPSSVVQSN